ncbi:MAG TPA: Npt1/Npt2 family nucleotide transporter [Bryobacteraceae bacterium]|jgi:AAA family ATP:ADP antiporter|nr:Npt1/Npt2 family nucleotide transporter [Bryobacteraceae bacterium]
MSGAGATDSGPKKGVVEKVLSLLADVRAGESAGVLLLALNSFLLLMSYYLLKTVREPLILTQGGAEVKAYSAAAQALLLLAIVPAYGALASRVSRIRLITWVTLIFVANLLLFYAFGVAGVREGVVFFLWVGIFNVFIVALFWSFANDLYSESHGKRLFPAIAVGGSLGSLVGAQAAAMIMRVTGPYPLMLIAAGVLVVCLMISRVIHYRAASDPAHFSAGHAAAPLARTGALELLLRDRYLLLIALLVLLLNIVNNSGEFLLGKLVTADAIRVAGSNVGLQERIIGEFYGHYEVWYNSVALGLQMFAVSRVFRYAGVRGALFILPALAMGSYSFLLLLPLLPVIRWLKILENGADYSVQNTTVHALFLPTSREAKYKAKAAIDTFFKRAGDVLEAGVVKVGSAFDLGIQGFAVVNLVLTLVWFAVAFGIARAHRRAEQEPQPKPADAPVLA